MTANVESMMFQGETPWHGLGTYVDHAPTASEAMELAGLSWDVAPEPVYVKQPDGTFTEVPTTSMNRKAMRRSSDGRVLAILGDQYTPLQNKDAFAFFDPFVNSGLFEYHTAGSLNGGRLVWVLCSLSGSTREVVKGDPVQSFMLLANSHDGSSSVQSINTSVRVVCCNTLAAAQSQGKYLSKARHTRGMVLKMDQMQEDVAAMNKSFKEALDKYKFLASAQVNGKALELYIKALFGKDADDEKMPKGSAQIIDLFERGRGQQIKGARGTMWAALNAVTEYVDHYRGNDSKPERRLQSAWFGQGADMKRKALEVAMKGAIALKAA